jgi:hypothetical protein
MWFADDSNHMYVSGWKSGGDTTALKRSYYVLLRDSVQEGSNSCPENQAKGNTLNLVHIRMLPVILFFFE